MLEKGDKIGDYTLARFLGKGQFGEVWLAEKNLQFSSRKFQHALKFLSNLGNEIDLKSAEAEIDTWIEASGHPNVMSVMDMFAHREHIIIVSEYAEGGSLKVWLDKSNGKAPSFEKALEMMRGILRGIEHLHSRNVVHRDLKPDNILLQGNFPRITDFGISRIVSTDSMLTKVIGSPAYMSPESFDGIKSPQTDIWSAGVIMYEMLTGGHPFFSESIFGLVAVIQREEPKPLPDYVPFVIRKVVEMALQRDMTKRFQTARDMRLAVEQATYELKANSQSQAAVTEVLLNVSSLIDPPKKNEMLVDSFVLPSENKPAANVVQVPVTRSPADIDQQVRPMLSETSQDLSTRPRAEVEQPTQPSVPDSPSDIITRPRADIELETHPAIVQTPSEYFTHPRTDYGQETQNALVDATQDPSALGKTIQTQSQPQMVITGQPLYEKANHNPAARRAVIFLGIFGGGLFSILALFLTGAFVYKAYFSGGSGGNGKGGSGNFPVSGSSPVANIDGNIELPTKKTQQPPPNMVRVEGGEFLMGRSDGKFPDEGPEHNEKVKPFFIDKYEVTNGEYSEFVKKGHPAPLHWIKGNFPAGEERFPVVGITWMDAKAYAESIGKRLPTEEEWEFAARGPNSLLYPWGNNWENGNANIDGASPRLVEVGKFKGESPFGIFDMIGNAAEWTEDDFKAYPEGRLSPYYSGKSNLKTVRGNGFDATRDAATSTYRLGWPATGASSYAVIGFRCAKGVD